MLPLLDPSGVAINRGRFINIIDGIQGVSAGGVANINLATNIRAHRIKLQCTAVNYTGSTTAQATTHVTGSGADDLTAHITVSTVGVPTAATVNAGGTGYTTGDKIIIADATGTGQQWTVTASGGVVSALALVASTATASAIDPGALLDTVKILVNGVTMRDITARLILMINQANGTYSALGDLDINFTEPSRNWIRANEATSWDLFGQNTFVISPKINSGYLLPGISGFIEFDYLRNAYTPAGAAPGSAPVPNLEPITHHIQSFQIAGSTAGTVNPLTTIPIEFPIARLWLLGSSTGNITALELLQDGVKRLEGSAGAIKNLYENYGFQFGQANYGNQTQTAQKTLTQNPFNYFDAAYISDVSGRYDRALKCAKSLSLRVTSTATQTLTVLVEALPGAYQT